MSQDVASLDTIGATFDTGAKFMRLMGKAGTTLAELQRPIDSPAARRNLAAYLAAGCPKLPAIASAEPTLGVNEHGHVTLTFTGLDLSGADEIERLVEAGYRTGDFAKSCFTSNRPDSYDGNHRLVSGQSYTVAFVPRREISRDRDRTTAGLQRHAVEKYGYEKPLAGIVPRIREAVSDQKMEEMGVWYIAALHDPIKDSDGSPSVLIAGRGGDGRWVDASWDGPGNQWDTGGAFAFLVPAK